MKTLKFLSFLGVILLVNSAIAQNWTIIPTNQNTHFVAVSDSIQTNFTYCNSPSFFPIQSYILRSSSGIDYNFQEGFSPLGLYKYSNSEFIRGTLFGNQMKKRTDSVIFTNTRSYSYRFAFPTIFRPNQSWTLAKKLNLTLPNILLTATVDSINLMTLDNGLIDSVAHLTVTVSNHQGQSIPNHPHNSQLKISKTLGVTHLTDYSSDVRNISLDRYFLASDTISRFPANQSTTQTTNKRTVDTRFSPITNYTDETKIVRNLGYRNDSLIIETDLISVSGNWMFRDTIETLYPRNQTYYILKSGVVGQLFQSLLYDSIHVFGVLKTNNGTVLSKYFFSQISVNGAGPNISLSVISHLISWLQVVPANSSFGYWQGPTSEGWVTNEDCITFFQEGSSSFGNYQCPIDASFTYDGVKFVSRSNVSSIPPAHGYYQWYQCSDTFFSSCSPLLRENLTTYTPTTTGYYALVADHPNFCRDTSEVFNLTCIDGVNQISQNFDTLRSSYITNAGQWLRCSDTNANSCVGIVRANVNILVINNPGFYRYVIPNSQLSCSDTSEVYEAACIPIQNNISFNGGILSSSQMNATYQWIFCTDTNTVSSCNFTLSTNQTHVPNNDGFYACAIETPLGCKDTSNFFFANCAIPTYTINRNGNTLSTSTTASSYEWLECVNGGLQSIPNQLNRSFLPNKNGNYAVALSNGNCIDTSGCFQFNCAMSTSFFVKTDSGLYSSTFSNHYQWLEEVNGQIVVLLADTLRFFDPQRNGRFAIITTALNGNCTDTSIFRNFQCSVKGLSIVSSDSLIESSVLADEYQWLDCSIYPYVPIPNATLRTFKPSPQGRYVLAVKQGQCYDTSGCFVYIGMNELAYTPEVNVVNPIKDQLLIISDFTFDRMILYNQMGQMVFEGPYESNTTVDFLSSGTYYLQLISDRFHLKKKLIVLND